MPAPPVSPQATPTPTKAPVAGSAVKPTVRPTLKPVVTARPTPVSTPRAKEQPLAPQAGSAGIWKNLFEQWPQGISPRGILVTKLNEQLPFKAFMTRGELVLLERTNPDTLGARFLMVPYTEVALVKLTDPIKQETFEKANYSGKLST